MKQKSYSFAKTVQKAFKLLEVLAEKQPLKPADLLNHLALSRSNLYRLLETLTEMGYVHKGGGNTYCLTYKIFMLGSSFLNLNQLTFMARPYMAHLAEMSQENVNLAIMYENKVLYIDKIESKHYLKLDQPIGATDPLHCTALGKILLSGLSDLEMQIFLKSTTFIPYTKNTITDPEVLAGVVRNVRTQGYAIDFEELSYGIHCIGAPIRDYTNKVIAAMSISGPSVRLTKLKTEELKAPLIESTVEVSKRMGCTNFGISNLV
jgi:DNA-binding IclR family transcriptional regulator